MRTELKEIINEFDLHADDVYVHKTKGWKIIKRRGYKAIQVKLGLDIVFDLAYTDGKDCAVVKAKGYSKSKQVRETYGEASPKNNTFAYPIAVAQKRAEGRLILEIADLYRKGWMTEDEIDENVEREKIISRQDKKSKDAVDATIKAINDSMA